MKSLAIITARGGSKRIPRKNIKTFMGKPMLAYAIEAAQKSTIFSEIMVSTDDDEIANVAREHGANVPFLRSEKTSDDFATTADVICEVIEKFKKQGKVFNEICCIYPCVPFLTPQTLQRAYNEFQGYDALMPVCKFPVPIEWAMKIEGDMLFSFNKEAQNIRSQDLEAKYFDAGMFYFTKTKTFLENLSFSVNAKAFIMQDKEVQDIDTLEDWSMAELKYKLLNSQ